MAVASRFDPVWRSAYRLPAGSELRHRERITGSAPQMRASTSSRTPRRCHRSAAAATPAAATPTHRHARSRHARSRRRHAHLPPPRSLATPAHRRRHAHSPLPPRPLDAELSQPHLYPCLPSAQSKRELEEFAAKYGYDRLLMQAQWLLYVADEVFVYDLEGRMTNDEPITGPTQFGGVTGFLGQGSVDGFATTQMSAPGASPSTTADVNASPRITVQQHQRITIQIAAQCHMVRLALVEHCMRSDA